MIITRNDDIGEFLAANSGRSVAVRAIGWPEFEIVPAGRWCWTDTREMRAPGLFNLLLIEIMEAGDPCDVVKPEPSHEAIRLFEPAPTQIAGQLSM